MDKFYECDPGLVSREEPEDCPACVDSAEWHALGWTDYYCRKHGKPSDALVSEVAARPLVDWMVK